MKQCTFIHQAKYTNDLIKKFNMTDLKSVLTSMSMAVALNSDENGESVDQREYMSMIGSLLYLTMTQSDIQFTLCMCALFQASPRFSHWTAVL
jgi:hypothetical protein